MPSLNVINKKHASISLFVFCCEGTPKPIDTEINKEKKRAVRHTASPDFSVSIKYWSISQQRNLN